LFDQERKVQQILVEAGKKYRNNQNAHTKKLPDWVPEKKVTNPFLNLLLRKNERDIDNKKKAS
jgi:hypothetical protein